MMNKMNCFTRVELVVCCAVAGLFAAMLTPLLRHAPALAQSESCKLNLKRMGEGAVEYTLDFDGKLPGGALEPNQRWFTERGLRNNKRNFLYSLSEYIGTDHFSCPGAQDAAEPVYKPKDPKERCSYLVNGVLSDLHGQGGVKLERVKALDSVIFLGDRGVTRIGISVVARANADGTHRSGQNWWRAEELVHGKNFNFLFADNHVAELTPHIIKGQRGNIDGRAHYGMTPAGKVVFEQQQ